jgi:hypothetical protein
MTKGHLANILIYNLPQRKVQPLHLPAATIAQPYELKQKATAEQHSSKRRSTTSVAQSSSSVLHVTPVSRPYICQQTLHSRFLN